MRNAIFAVWLFVVLPSNAAWAANGEFDVLATVPIHSTSDILCIPAKVDDVDCEIMIDTGATEFIVDRTLATDITDVTASVINAAGQTIRLAMGKSPGVTIGEWRLEKGQACLVTDFRELQSRLGRNVCAVVGCRELKAVVLETDAQNGILKIWKTRGVPLTDIPRLKREWLVIGGNGVPHVRCSGLTKKLFCQVDTGFGSDLEIEGKFFDQLLEDGLLVESPAKVSMQVAGGAQEVRCGHLNYLQFGEKSFARIEVIRGNANRMGWPLWRRAYTRMDCGERYVDYFSTWSPPERLYRFQLRLRFQKRGDSFVVSYADPNSAFKIDDVLKSIDDHALSKMTLDELFDLLRIPDNTYCVTVQRGSDHIVGTVTTGSMIPLQKSK